MEEASDELHDLKGYGSAALAVWFFIAEGDGMVLGFDNAAIRDGHFEDIGSKISETMLAGSGSLAVDVPVGLPYFRWNGTKKPRFVDLVAEFGSKDLGQGSDGQIEIDT